MSAERPENPQARSARRAKPLGPSGALHLPARVQWHEGMLLGPQHFQHSDRRHEELIDYRARLAQPFSWGIRFIRHDPGQLTAGIYRLVELEAVMPDGTIVSVEAQDGSHLEVDLNEHLETVREKPRRLHLLLPAYQRGVPTAEGGLARYASFEGDPAVDEATGRGEQRIPLLRPRPHLVLDDDPPKKFVRLPLGEIALHGDSFTFTDYEPPWLRVAPGSRLFELCAEMAQRLREKAAFLAEQAGSPAAAMRRPQLLETRSLLQCLVSALPPFEALLYTGVAHPFELYRGLCALAGQLAGASRRLVPPIPEIYDHENPQSAISHICRFATKALEEGIVEGYTGFRFQRDGGRFSLVFDAAWLDLPLVVGLRFTDSVDTQAATRWATSCYIASRSRFSALHERRVPGAGRRASEGDEDLLPARGVLLYELDADDGWIDADEPLDVVNPEDPDNLNGPVELVLYVKNG